MANPLTLSFQAKIDAVSNAATMKFLRVEELKANAKLNTNANQVKARERLKFIANSKAQLRKKQRHMHIARGLAWGKSYAVIETNPKTLPDWELVRLYLASYVGRKFFIQSLTSCQLSGGTPIQDLYEEAKNRGHLNQLYSEWRSSRERYTSA